jgi:hypothetical protein
MPTQSFRHQINLKIQIFFGIESFEKVQIFFIFILKKNDKTIIKNKNQKNFILF